MVKVLFVCLGNICRSPLAEAIFNHKVNQHGLNHQFRSDSCGTSDFHIGELPDDRTIACATNHNIPINHRARQINRIDVREFDYLLVMDYSNKKNVEEFISKQGMSHERLHLIREFQEDAASMEVPDPYYGGMEAFENVYEILDDAIDRFLQVLKENNHELV
ncbi:low molecular weight phosphotyrosine protein phosphatase [Mongoliitalea daihaiensis]|nr:low molecular weight protein-tyrosine-phosphatase [Mongoliitalea daihaiensis]UJP67036.1 low molecular weight phosphotyrosine protein phosphatase [Mongoliitalea daihaiensis]